MRNAIVTGATKGIGLAVARMLLAEGYRVVITYAHDEVSAESCRKQLSEQYTDFTLMKVDQSDRGAVKAFAERIKSDFGHLDCLVCNAGATLREPLQGITDEAWEKVMNVNVNNNVFLIRDLYSSFPAGSRIIFIGSMMGIHPHGTSLAYGVTKSAVHALALNLVKCFEGTGTTVNVVAPGFVETEWQREKPEEIRNNICAKTALGRFATVDEVADAVRFCLNNAFVNGSVIEVSGGYSYR